MGDIQINRPEEVKERIRREAELLNAYYETLQEESRELISIDGMIEKAENVIREKNSGLYLALDQTGRQPESEARNRAVFALQRQIEKNNARLRELEQCAEGLQEDRSRILRQSEAIAVQGNNLSGRILKLIQMIIDSK